MLSFNFKAKIFLAHLFGIQDLLSVIDKTIDRLDHDWILTICFEMYK